MSEYFVVEKERGNPHVIVFFTSVDCGPPVVPQHGSLESYTDTTEGSEVFYSCDPGLVPDGRMRSTCTESGWSPNPTHLNCTGDVSSKYIGSVKYLK